MKQPAKPSRVLAVVGLAVFLSILDLFIVNIAFPDLRRDFEGSSLTSLSWVLTTYAIVYAAVLVPAGRLGDLYGRRLLFVIGLGLFTFGSALCAVAPTLETLVAARVLQGIGAAAPIPCSTRAATSVSSVGATAHSAEPKVNSASPMTNSRRRP